MGRIFRPADILLPESCDMTKWSVVACDQFSSQPEYWDELEEFVGPAPSTLRLMLPEAYLSSRDQQQEADKISACMRSYLDGGIFKELKNSYIYAERTLKSGAVRRGVVGVLDLEAYDYSAASVSPIRATEGTVEDRLPARVRIRMEAPLEMPHIMVFIDDEADRVIGDLTAESGALPKLYDFELNCGGGHLRGWKVSGADAERFDKALYQLEERQSAPDVCRGAAPVLFAMGDGNHSLATAKKCWEELKPTLSEAEREDHPARFSLVEVVNIHDPAVSFEPIHKVLFGTDAADFIPEAQEFFASFRKASGDEHELLAAANGRQCAIRVCGLTIGQLIEKAEEFCVDYSHSHGGKIDYIHNDDTALEMAGRLGGAALLLPRMEKNELFPSIMRSGPFPKKSFSIGHAEDKRYYLECRKIK